MNNLISDLGLETVRHSKGYMLSGGERRVSKLPARSCCNPILFSSMSLSPVSIRFRFWNSNASLAI